MRKWLLEELKEIPCDFCGSREVAREFIRADGMRVVECAVCGLAYLNPRPRPELIPEFYKEDYFTGASAERGEGGLKLNLDISSSKSSANDQNISRPIQIINEKFGGLQGKDVLEIGCATGDLLSKIKKAGANAKGLEISEFAADMARKRGFEVITGTIEDYSKIGYDKVDIILVLEVIEHVLSPTRFIQHCTDLLKPTGLLILSTPNYTCTKRFGKDWLGFKTSFEHMYFFSEKSIEKMVEKFNMCVAYWETSKHPGMMLLNREKVHRILHRIYYLRALAGQFGIVKSIKVFMGTFGTIFYPYGIGHTLTIVVKKAR